MCGKLPDNEFKKSRTLIRSACRLSLNANRILDLICRKILNMPEETVCVGMVITASASEIADAFATGGRSGYIYQMGSAIADELRKAEFTFRDQLSGKVQSVVMLPDVAYVRAAYHVTVNEVLLRTVRDSGKDYTRFTFQEMGQFHSGYAYRLFEFIKSECGEQISPCKMFQKTSTYQISINQYELAFLTGAVALDTDGAKKAFYSGNFREAYDMAFQKSYSTAWRLRQKIFDPAVKEISFRSSIRLSYTYTGETLCFTAVTDAAGVLSELKQVQDMFFPECVDLQTAHDIYREASGDLELIQEAVGKLQRNASRIRNPTGFVIYTIRQLADRKAAAMQTAPVSAGEPTRLRRQKADIGNGVLDFPQRKYDMAALERELLHIE